MCILGSTEERVVLRAPRRRYIRQQPPPRSTPPKVTFVRRPQVVPPQTTVVVSNSTTSAPTPSANVGSVKEQTLSAPATTAPAVVQVRTETKVEKASDTVSEPAPAPVSELVEVTEDTSSSSSIDESRTHVSKRHSSVHDSRSQAASHSYSYTHSRRRSEGGAASTRSASRRREEEIHITEREWIHERARPRRDREAAYRHVPPVRDVPRGGGSEFESAGGDFRVDRNVMVSRERWRGR